ncbi:FAD-binding and (Fe-S)-binding domain-containing protein [Rubrobacter calidifluminis]|uniref:FAD-binding and (Fe-S)-binding domain-containing protein n=1 Tax=Rubrobacter calidifluminis TaxID=1392640 RepID=UPI00235F56E3|nr:FAD-binding and (Fe-S)-binding domain-containing protein [Rubrobacter calidifluminis]
MTETTREGYRRLSQRQRLNLNTLALQAELRERVRGEVRFDAGTRAAYAHDSSNYRQVPFGVVLPLDEEDVIEAVRVCHRHGAPVLPRGCGTSLSGETTNAAVVLDTSKYMREILEVNPDEGCAWVQPGVVRDQLSEMTQQRYDMFFAPDTSTHQWATFGGMIGNNSCGVHSVMAGRTSDNVYELDVVLYDGTRMTLGETSDGEFERVIREGGRKGEIYQKLRDLRDRYAGLIRERYPQIPRRVSGYNLDELLPEKGFNTARAVVGSEGTLVTILRAKVRLVHSPPARTLLVLGYPTIFDAGDHVPEVMEQGPIGLEAIDDALIEDMKLQNMHHEDLKLLPEGGGWLLAEFGGESPEESQEKARRAMEAIRRSDNPPEMKVFADPTEAQEVWGIREDGLGATAYVPGSGDYWEGWEDAAVPPERMGDYLRDFRALLDRYDYRTALYGHFGDGCIHCRINFDLKTAGGIRKWRAFLDEAADLVVSYGGSLSGEHGDGQARAELLPKMYGEELMEAFREYKRIWDPDWKMNPGKVIDAYPITSNLRHGTDYNPYNPDHLYFSYPEDGGSFAHATMRCVGVGKCRDIETGTMCPSYMVTREEEHSTRGRARLLHEMLRGKGPITDGFKSREVFDALDLCLSCKGCKGDCPVNVDMATYKAEFLARYYKGRLRPAYAYTMGLIMLHARIAQYAPRLANFVTQTPGISALVKRLGGIAAEREMPPFATRTFKDWMRERTPRHPDGPPVVLFPDTFNNFLHPETMKASVEVLEHAGYRVLVPQEALCCGRPLYDYGMLDTAKTFLRRLVDTLAPYVREGIKVVVVEPSCAAAFRDELPNMMPHDEDANRLVKNTRTLSEFLVEEDYVPPRLGRKALFHSHCQGEAVIGTQADVELMERLGLDYEVLDSGCCGLAGSFGFERDHYDISMQIGERRLLPAVREAGGETLLIADGFSCKTQVEQGTDRRPLHLAQVIKMALDHGEEGPPRGTYPERGYPDVVLDGGGANPKALAAAGGIAAAAAIAWGLRRRA